MKNMIKKQGINLKRLPKKRIVEVIGWDVYQKLLETRDPSYRENKIFDAIETVFNNSNRKNLEKTDKKNEYSIMIHSDIPITINLLSELENISGFNVSITSVLYGINVSFRESKDLNPSKR